MRSRNDWIAVISAVLLLIAIVAGVGWNAQRHSTRMRLNMFISSDAKTSADVLEEEVGLVRLHHGDGAASEYRRCRLEPPPLVQDRLKCQKLFERFKRESAEWRMNAGR
jgi:hypothetical protein